MPPSTAPRIVFHDGSCPLCRREIAFYRRRVPAGAVEWRDVSTAAVELPAGLDRRAAMARFHVQRPDGRLVSGGPAFAELWCCVPGLRWAGAIGRRPPVSWLLEAGYRLLLPLRPRLQRWLTRRQARA